MNDSDLYGSKVRVRVCGLCFKHNELLLIKQKINNRFLWAPPGGGVDFNSGILKTLIKEFKEETSLTIKPGRLLFVTEFIESPFHAVEIYFDIAAYSGVPTPGYDPEQDETRTIYEAKFLNDKQIQKLTNEEKHHILKMCKNPKDLLLKTGFI